MPHPDTDAPREPSHLPSPEQFATISTRQGELEICYQTFGDPADEAMLLVMGLGGPMTWWNADFCGELARRGFYVIRFDNRDTGRSSKVGSPISRRGIASAFMGRPVSSPYTLVDMAEDGFALVDQLGIEQAHVVGISMGGMIAQTMALGRPDQVLSLTSIMSTTGRRTVGWQDPRLLPLLLARRRQSREQYVAASARLWKVIGSPLYPDTTETVQERAGETWDRGVSASGVARQMAAIVTAPDRTRTLRELDLPALVIHGMHDRMIHVSGGRATAHALRGSELLLVPGMGHDVPRDLHTTFADAIQRTARRARHRRGAGQGSVASSSSSAASR